MSQRYPRPSVSEFELRHMRAAVRELQQIEECLLAPGERGPGDAYRRVQELLAEVKRMRGAIIHALPIIDAACEELDDARRRAMSTALHVALNNLNGTIRSGQEEM